MNSESWIDSFHRQSIGRIFVKVNEEFINNQFNVFGIKKIAELGDEAYEILKSPLGSIDPSHKRKRDLENSLRLVYGIIHFRFLQTKIGQDKMHKKLMEKEFPSCPRVFCKDSVCLPYGIDEELGKSTMKWYCPNCCDVYNPDNNELNSLDGAFFGHSWVHMFIGRYPDIISKSIQRVYVPKVYGFRMYREKHEEEDDYSEND